MVRVHHMAWQPLKTIMPGIVEEIDVGRKDGFMVLIQKLMQHSDFEFSSPRSMKVREHSLPCYLTCYVWLDKKNGFMSFSTALL